MEKNNISKNIDPALFDDCKKVIAACRKEASKRLIGQNQVIDGILTDVSYDGISDYLEDNGIFCGGSLLLELEYKYCR